jgi:4-hydroxy-tetrahydrodipicolinate synthase
MVPLITPFRDALDIDWSAFDEHVLRMLAAGMTVLMPGDLVGEAWALTFEEKVSLFERTVRLSAGRAIVVAKLSEPALPGIVALARAARAASVDAVKITMPPSLIDHEAAHEYVMAAVQASGVPFLIETGGREVPLAALDRLIGDSRCAGVEETGLDLDRFDELILRFGARLPVIAGSEDALGYTLLLGASGFMTATPNVAPAFMRALWEAGAARDAPSTLAQYRRLLGYRRLFAADVKAGQPMFVSYTKAAMELMGYRAGPPRPPLRRLSDAECRTLTATLRDCLDLEPQQGGATC